LGKRHRRFATRHTHSLRSDRPFPSIVPPSPRTSAQTILSVGAIVALVVRSARKTAPFRLRLGRVLPIPAKLSRRPKSGSGHFSESARGLT
jgi:hypothetical protein